MKNIFDDIYKNNLDVDYGELFRNFADDQLKNLQNKNNSPIEEEKLTYSEEQIERLLATSRIQEDKPFTEEERKLAETFINDLRIKLPALRKEIFDFKSELHLDILEQNDKFSLDISKNENLRNIAYQIFEANKTKITYEDYMVLLEMKREIEIREQAEFILEEENGIFE